MFHRCSVSLLWAALAGSVAVHAQGPATPHWDVISVKPMPASSCKPNEGGVRYLPNGLSASCVPVLFTLEFAYSLFDPARIVGLPRWALGSQLYSIDARVGEADVATFTELRREQKAAMMQGVLAERFGLVAHREQRTLPALTLVVGKGGTRLRPVPPDAPLGRSQFGGGDGEVEWVNAPLNDLRFLLAQETGRPVVDSTGLTGRYSFSLRYTPAARAAAADGGGPSISTALEEQLGLRLVPGKQDVEVVVVDAIAAPTPN